MALKNIAKMKLSEYHHWPKVEDTIKYMFAEDWHEKHWEEFKAYNIKTDELQKMNLLETCEEFKDFV